MLPSTYTFTFAALLGTTRDFPSCFDVESTFSVYFGLAFLDSTRP